MQRSRPLVKIGACVCVFRRFITPPGCITSHTSCSPQWAILFYSIHTIMLGMYMCGVCVCVCTNVLTWRVCRGQCWRQGWTTPCPSSPPQWWDLLPNNLVTSPWPTLARWDSHKHLTWHYNCPAGDTLQCTVGSYVKPHLNSLLPNSLGVYFAKCLGVVQTWCLHILIDVKWTYPPCSPPQYMPANAAMQATFIPQYTQVPPASVSVEVRSQQHLTWSHYTWRCVFTFGF